MKNFHILTLFTALGLGGAACSKTEETINKRTGTQFKVLAGDDKDASPAVVDKGTVWAGLELVEAPRADQLGADFLANIMLVSKISENQIVLMGADGRSWLYNPGDDAPLELIEAVTVKIAGSSLYTLPNGQFWLVGPDEIGKRKAGEEGAAGTAITLQSFGTDKLDGDKTKLQVLYAGVDDLILHLGTHIVILSNESGRIITNQFAIANLPVSLGETITAAGKANGNSFWLASKDSLALIEPKGLSFIWSKINLPMAGHENYKNMALWLDQASKSALGDAVLIDGGKILSVSGAPLAP